MPGGFTQPLGLLAFPVIKIAGYTAFAIYLNRTFPQNPRNVLLVGFSRMIIGLVLGTILATLSFPFAFVFGLGAMIYFVGLVPVRIFEWWLLIKAFYPLERSADWSVLKQPIFFGVLTSFILDIPALVGVVYAANFWIC